MNISFENTENAFAYKANKDLKGAKFLFSTMGFPLFVQLGTRLTPFLMKTGLPIHGIIRKTIFKQFVGGETLEETANVGEVLGKYGVKVILRNFVLKKLTMDLKLSQKKSKKFL
jgi:proline dehydrogenase